MMRSATKKLLIRLFQKISDQASLCHALQSLHSKRTSCMAMREHLISTTSLITVGMCADISADVASARTRIYSHHCLMLFHQQRCQELSLFIIAMLSRIFHFTETVRRCVCARAFVCLTAYLCLSFTWELMSLFLCLSDCIFIFLLFSQSVLVCTTPPKGCQVSSVSSQPNPWHRLTGEGSASLWGQEQWEQSHQLGTGYPTTQPYTHPGWLKITESTHTLRQLGTCGDALAANPLIMW